MGHYSEFGEDWRGHFSSKTLRADAVEDATRFIAKYPHVVEFLSLKKYDAKGMVVYAGAVPGGQGTYYGSTSEDGGIISRIKGRDADLASYEKAKGNTSVPLDGMAKMQLVARLRFGENSPQARAKYVALNIKRSEAKAAGTSLFLFGDFFERVLAYTGHSRSTNSEQKPPSLKMPYGYRKKYAAWLKDKYLLDYTEWIKKNKDCET